MAVITQNYDIDLKATGEFPIVKMSQFDTGSRTIVFTVYDGHELAQIDGMVARVDGTRSDGVEFSSTCAVGTGSRVSFTISQEMTKQAGKHAAELVIFDADGSPIGTQNFIIDVEAASMSRDSAASADDRTLYDQYTASIEKKFGNLSSSLTAKADALTKTAEDISGLVGASSKPTTIYSEDVTLNSVDTIHVRLTYDPLTALVHAHAYGSLILSTRNDQTYSLCKIDKKYCPDKELFDFTSGSGTGYYRISADNMNGVASGDTSETSDCQNFYISREDGVCTLRFHRSKLPDHAATYELSLNAVWYASGGKYIGVQSIGTGGNTLKIGKTTTGAPGTQATVVNSGTAKDVVLDFTIPRGAVGTGAKGAKGDKGDTGTRGNRIYYSKYESAPNSGSHWWADLKPTVSVADPPIKGDFVFTPAGNLMSITGVNVNASASGGGTYDVGAILTTLKGQKGDKGDAGGGTYTLPAATSTTVGGVKIGEGINVAADGTIDVKALADSISQMQSKYDALISSATYDIDGGLTKGTWYDDYTWKFCRLRVVGGVCTLSFSATRKSGVWNAKAWDRAHVLTLPDGLGSLGEVNTPIVTNANAEPNNSTALQIQGNKVALRPTVDTTYNTGTWFQGTVSWVAAGSQSDDVSNVSDDPISQVQSKVG